MGKMTRDYSPPRPPNIITGLIRLATQATVPAADQPLIAGNLLEDLTEDAPKNASEFSPLSDIPNEDTAFILEESSEEPEIKNKKKKKKKKKKTPQKKKKKKKKK